MKYMITRPSKIGILYWNGKEWSDNIESVYLFNSQTAATNIVMFAGGNVVEVA